MKSMHICSSSQLESFKYAAIISLCGYPLMNVEGTRKPVSKLAAMNIIKGLGISHAELNMVYCSHSELLDDHEAVLRILREGARRAGMTVVSEGYFHFKGCGLTASVYLAQSQAHYHSYPEEKSTALIDIEACKPRDLSAGIDYYLQAFDPAIYQLGVKVGSRWRYRWIRRRK